MSTQVRLYKRFNKQFELEINSLIAKTDFVATTYPSVLTEVHTYLATDDGIARLSGIYVDPGVPNISYSHSSDGTSFSDYNIQYFDQTL